MSSNPPVQALGVSKCYTLYPRPADRLKQAVVPRLRRALGMAPRTYYQPFWALREVSVQVERGQCLGVLGRKRLGQVHLVADVGRNPEPHHGAGSHQGARDRDPGAWRRIQPHVHWAGKPATDRQRHGPEPPRTGAALRGHRGLCRHRRFH